MGISEVIEWDLDSITKRDLRISDLVIFILEKWNKEYLNIPVENAEEAGPSAEELAKIEEFKKKGWI